MHSSLSTIIPADWSQWSATKPSLIGPLTGGLTNQSFLISADNKVLVLRLNSAISAALDLNRVAEAQAIRFADAAGLCAPSVYCDPQYQYLITHYLAGDRWPATADGLTQLARLLRQIHQLPALDAVLNVSVKIAHYWRSINGQCDFIPVLKSLDEKVKIHIDRAEMLSDGRCLCHNDLLIDNLIAADDGKLYAIDWEYAATADPFYELAVIVEGHGFNSSQQQIVIAAYLDRAVSNEDWQRLFHWRIIYNYLTLLWYVVQFSKGAMTQPSINQEINDQIRHLSELMAQGISVDE